MCGRVNRCIRREADLSDLAKQIEAGEASGVPRLRRVLSLWDLILYGIVAVTPSAPVTVFGLAMVMSRGHALDTILIAMVAMVLTAFSYGRMAALYPSAGSAYTYVGRGLNSYLGFLAGWAMQPLSLAGGPVGTAATRPCGMGCSPVHASP